MDKINLRLNIIENKIDFYRQFGILEELNIALHFKDDFIVQMNSELAKILIDNILNNAIKHNIGKGIISISGDALHLQIENTGHELKVDTASLFNRFERSNLSSAGSGLGLAIVKEICNSYSLEVDYTVMQDLHIVKISKN
jgi:signal transduction histidine kinase